MRRGVARDGGEATVVGDAGGGGAAVVGDAGADGRIWGRRSDLGAAAAVR